MASKSIPRTSRSLVLQKSPAERKPLYHDVALEERPIPALEEGQVLVKINAVAFNHRDVWIRKGMYPAIGVGCVMGADGAGVVVAAHNPHDPLLHKRVFLTPSRGWIDHPDAPETHAFSVIGGVRWPEIGTFAEYIAVERDEVIPSPEHLDDVHTAALPLGLVTAYRATIINAKVSQGQNVLVTGIGGGVAVLALQLCLAKGAKVFVTSGSPDKIKRAIKLGASGGVNYKDKDWPNQLTDLLKHKTDSGLLDAVIDSAGGDIMNQTLAYTKLGGVVVCYGMTAAPKITFTMKQVMRNQRLIGSTMGSRADLAEAARFVTEHGIIPVVSQVVSGLANAEEGFESMRKGEQFGKIVIQVEESQRAKL